MKQGLTPYLLTLAPIVMFIAFMTGPDEVRDQDYLNWLKDQSLTMMAGGTIVVTIGAVMMFGGWFVLTQDMMAKSNKTQQDLLMLSRVALIFPMVLLLLATGIDMENWWVIDEGVDDYYTVEEEEAIVLNNHNVKPLLHSYCFCRLISNIKDRLAVLMCIGS